MFFSKKKNGTADKDIYDDPKYCYRPEQQNGGYDNYTTWRKPVDLYANRTSAKHKFLNIAHKTGTVFCVLNIVLFFFVLLMLFAVISRVDDERIVFSDGSMLTCIYEEGNISHYQPPVLPKKEIK